MLIDVVASLSCSLVTLPLKEESIEVGSNDKGYLGYVIRMRRAFDDLKTRWVDPCQRLVGTYLGLEGSSSSRCEMHRTNPSRGRLTSFRIHKGQVSKGSRCRTDGKSGKRGGRNAQASISMQGCAMVVVSGD